MNAKDRRNGSALSRSQWMCVLLCAGVLGTGCVRRRMTVRSNPPGAQVYIDKQYIGQTPCSTAFTYYGTREIEIVADGYRTERVLRTISPPWYQYPGLDFISETLIPNEVRDERVIDITMVPADRELTEDVVARGQALRQEARAGIARGLPAAALPGGQPFGSSQPNGPGVIAPPAFTPLPPGSVSPGSILPPATVQPGGVGTLQGIFQPNGIAPTRIPEVGVGGGYRPELPSLGQPN